MRTVCFILAVTCAAGPACCGVGISTICDGDTLRIHATILGDMADHESHHMVVLAQILGRCDPPEIVTPEPLPYPPLNEIVAYMIAIPAPDHGRYVHYYALRQNADCGLCYPGPLVSQETFCFEACNDAVFTRGRLWDWLSPFGELTLEVCPDHCWPMLFPLDFTGAEPGWEEYVDRRQVVDIYGEAWIDGVPGATRLDVSRVMPVTSEDGCDAVRNRASSWGRIKAMYR